MVNNYNIGALFQNAFGMAPGVVFNIPSPPSVRDVEQWAHVNGYKPGTPADETMGTEAKLSWLGTPIMFPMTFKGGNNLRMFNDKGQVERVRYADFPMPGATLVDFSRAKNIGKTEVAGGKGTVKELFSFDDWKIRIRGLCLNEPGIRTATEQKEALIAFEKLADTITVDGYFFRQFGIYQIVINSIIFRQVEGKPWVIPFEIDAESDEPIELVL